MPKVRKIVLAKPTIEAFFNESPTKAFREEELAGILFTYSEEWHLPVSQTVSGFIDFLLTESHLKQITLTSEHYRNTKRYIWDSPSIYAIALTLKNRSYLSHGSAVFLHGLTDQLPKVVYVNYEQSPKPQGGQLIQENINRAFSRPQRRSNFIYKYEDFQIVVVNGKFTDRLEVSPFTGSGGELLEVTKLERTLIDIAVRPAYAGGVIQVLEAFERAKPRGSVNTLVATLKKLNYIYPYHQVIGFYMERAGYPETQWQKLMKLGLEFDFYLTYQLPNDKKYDPKWRLYYPGSL
jgi:predicted transcriptional regulator of viral defense system